jgi:hypothetical protein
LSNKKGGESLVPPLQITAKNKVYAPITLVAPLRAGSFSRILADLPERFLK